MKKFAVLAAVAGLGLTSAAMADTIATFADPAANGSTPLFNVDITNNTISGGWSGPGLTLLTPGLSAPDFVDATFEMDETALTPIAPFIWTVDAGSVVFRDSGGAEIFTINFEAAILTANISFGIAELLGPAVTFTGPAIDQPLDNEQFAFSFANTVFNSNGFSVTSAFTSSADVVPTPGATALVGLAGVLAAKRRRK